MNRNIGVDIDPYGRKFKIRSYEYFMIHLMFTILIDKRAVWIYPLSPLNIKIFMEAGRDFIKFYKNKFPNHVPIGFIKENHIGFLSD